MKRAETAESAEAAKSAITPVVALEREDTEIVHITGEIMRAGFALRQARRDVVVGDP